MRSRLIAKDQDAEYRECLDCGALLEAAEMEQERQAPEADFGESLSDA